MIAVRFDTSIGPGLWRDLKTVRGYRQRLDNLRDLKAFTMFIEDDKGRLLKFLAVSRTDRYGRPQHWDTRTMSYRSVADIVATDKSQVYEVKP